MLKNKYGEKTLIEWGKELKMSKQAVHQFIKKNGFEALIKRIEVGNINYKPKLTLAMLKQRKWWSRYI
jgi:hypothetical protein